MKFLKSICFAALFPAVGCIAAAQVPASAADGGFYDIADRLVDANPALRAEAASTQAGVEELRAGAVPENPEVEFEHLWSGGAAENKWSAGITQSLPWPGGLRARSRAADLLSLARRHGLAQSERELRLKVLQTLTDVVAANRKVQILTEIHDSMAELCARYEQAWKQGETTILDLNKIKIEEIRSQSELEEAITQRNTLLAELRAIAPDTEIRADAASLADFPAVELSPLQSYLDMIDLSPEMSYLFAMHAVEQQNVAVQKASRLPGLSLGYRHAFEEGTHFNGFAVGLSLPVYSRRHDVAAAGARAVASEYTLGARRLEIEQSIRSDYSAAVSCHSQIGLYAPIVENVNNQALLRRALDGGQLSLLDYLQETTYFLRARLDYVDLTASYLRLAFSLSRYLVGGDAPSASQYESDESEIFVNPDMPPSYIHGGDKGLLSDLYTTILETAPVTQDSVKGRAAVSFVVSKEGQIDANSIKVVRNKSVPADYLEAAIEAIKKLGGFEPGKQLGTPKRVTYTIPVIYPVPLDKIHAPE